MQPFITFVETGENNKLQYFILQRDFPHYVGEVCEYPKNIFVQSVPVTGHNLWLCFWGTVRGQYIPAYTDVEPEIYSVLEQMRNWFYKNRILAEPKKYNKFKVNVSSTDK